MMPKTIWKHLSIFVVHAGTFSVPDGPPLALLGSVLIPSTSTRPTLDHATLDNDLCELIFHQKIPDALPELAIPPVKHADAVVPGVAHENLVSVARDAARLVELAWCTAAPESILMPPPDAASTRDRPPGLTM